VLLFRAVRSARQEAGYKLANSTQPLATGWCCHGPKFYRMSDVVCRRVSSVAAWLLARGSVDQWISGGRCSHGGAEARRKQREESTTRHKGNWRVSCFCLCVKHPWLSTGVLDCPGHPSCAGA
jgi:hypothetical protein